MDCHVLTSNKFAQTNLPAFLKYEGIIFTTLSDNFSGETTDHDVRCGVVLRYHSPHPDHNLITNTTTGGKSYRRAKEAMVTDSDIAIHGTSSVSQELRTKSRNPATIANSYASQ